MVTIEVRRRIGVAVVDLRGLVLPASGVADAFEARAGGGHVRAQRLLGASADRQIDEADDARRHPRGAIAAARRHGGDAVDELGLAQGAQLRCAVGAIAGRALDEHGRLDLVAAAGVGEQVGKEVAVRGEIPEVVMRVDDGEIGLQHLLLRQAQPVLADARHARGHRAMRLGRGHRRLPDALRTFLCGALSAIRRVNPTMGLRRSSRLIPRRSARQRVLLTRSAPWRNETDGADFSIITRSAAPAGVVAPLPVAQFAVDAGLDLARVDAGWKCSIRSRF